jgi:transcriptional regulator with XRE-family HTH domain
MHPPDDRKDFGDLLRWHRQRLGLSQAQLASAAGLAVRTIRGVELGHTRRPHQDSMRLLADALGLTSGAREAFEASAAGIRSLVDPSERGQVVPRQLPPDLPDFSGRTEEAGAVMALVASGSVAVISGPVGIGKTTLAVHVGHELSANFPDGLLYADLRGSACPVASEEVLGWFLRALGVEGEAIPPDPQERAALYRTRIAGGRTLVVLDDAADEAQVRPLLPGASHCRTLVTSRARLVALTGARLLYLGLPDAADAMEIVVRAAGRRLSPNELAAAEEIVERCGLLPLALQIAGARLAALPGLSCADLAERLRREGRRLDELAVRDLSIRGRLATSYRHLDEVARTAFRRLAQLETPTFAWPACRQLPGLPRSEAETAMQRLVDVGLVDVAETDGLRTLYRLHELSRLYGRELDCPGDGDPAEPAPGEPASGE